MNEPPGRPDHVDAARAMFFAFLAVGAIWSIAALVKEIPRDAINLLTQAAFFGAPLLYAKAAKLRPFQASGYTRLGLRPIALVLLASLGSMWLLQGLWTVSFDLLRRAGYEQQIREEVKSLDQSIQETKGGGTLFAGLMFVVAAPFCEETLFRGIVLRGLARRFGVLVSLALTTIVFAAMHEKLARVGMMVLLGFYFGTLVWLTGSLWAGILAHAANNFAVLILSGKYGSKVEGMTAPWWMYVLSALVFAGAMTLLALDRREKTTSS
jgi:membrane protease YdiL (CAAX protease family)